jgi:hypothetical protein
MPPAGSGDEQMPRDVTASIRRVLRRSSEAARGIWDQERGSTAAELRLFAATRNNAKVYKPIW